MCEPTACLEHEGGLVVGVDDFSVSHWLVLSVQPAEEEENNSENGETFRLRLYAPRVNH